MTEESVNRGQTDENDPSSSSQWGKKRLKTRGPSLRESCIASTGFVCVWASLVAQMVKNLPAMQETPVQSWEGLIL